jgi:hypothetical protein
MFENPPPELILAREDVSRHGDCEGDGLLLNCSESLESFEDDSDCLLRLDLFVDLSNTRNGDKVAIAPAACDVVSEDVPEQ